MSQPRRSTSRSSSSSNIDKNVSNSNTANVKRPQKDMKAQSNQKSPAGYKVLGQEREMTEDELWNTNGQLSDRVTPTSSRSSFGSRPVSNTSRRTPTPSKQITLQAVKRKEEIDEPLEPIDWNDFNRAVSQNETRIPTYVETDSDSDSIPSPRQPPMSEEAHLALVEQRAKQLTSALSTCTIDDQEADLSKKLEAIELEREKQREKEEAELKVKQSNTSEEPVNQNVSDRNVFEDSDKKDILRDERKIMDRKEADDILIVKRTGENVIGKHAMDKVKDTAMSSGSKSKAKSKDPESGKKDEASAKTGDTSSDEETEEEDLIGERGKAPTALLMEFVTCLMDKDYENAEKLCKMILIYEPDNPEALSFLPVIQEKREIDAAEPEASGSDDSDDESDDSGEEEDSDDDDDESSGSDDDDEDDEGGGAGDNDEDDEQPHSDSGIASANSD